MGGICSTGTSSIPSPSLGPHLSALLHTTWAGRWPAKTCPHPAPTCECDLVWEKGLCRQDLVWGLEMRSISWINPMTHVLVRDPRTEPIEEGAEMDNGPLEPPGAGRGRGLLPEASGGSPALRQLAFGLCLQGCKQTRSCCSEPGRWGHVLRGRRTPTGC